MNINIFMLTKILTKISKKYQFDIGMLYYEGEYIKKDINKDIETFFYSKIPSFYQMHL